MQEIAAAFAAMLLPQDLRDDLRSRKVTARELLRLFTPDHIHLHALGGTDRWWNLDMRLRDDSLKIKDRRDTAIVAKSRRIETKWGEHMRVRQRLPVASKKIKWRWPKRKMESRKSNWER